MTGQRAGFCACFSCEPQAASAAHMAAAFGRDQVRQALHPLGAAALAHPDGANVHEQDGLLVVSQGAPARLVAQLWRRLGVQACSALSGQFAFALFDARTQEGLVAADRFASRPLFYQQVGRSLVCATSMAVLARHPGAGRAPDPQALFDYLYLDGASGPRAPFAGQQRLAPGECLHLRDGRVERVSYWRMRYAEHKDTPVPHLRLREALAAAQPDNRLGAPAILFAGDAASTLLAAQLRRTDERQPHTYTLGFGDHDRAALARAAANARRLGCRHREQLLGPQDLIEAVALLAQYDVPCGDPAAVTALFAARMAREDGLDALAAACGAAELFGFDSRHVFLHRAARYERVPAALRQLLLEPLLFGLGARLPGHWTQSLRERIEQAIALPPQRLQRANPLSGHGASAVFERAFLAQVDTALPAAAQEANWWLAQARSPVNRATELALRGDLPYRMLPAFGAACAAAGVTPLLPFLDDNVVALASRLAPGLKTPRAGRRLIDRAVRAGGAEPSAGAGGVPALPFMRWLRSDAGLRAFVGDSLSDLAGRHIVRRGWLDRLLDRDLADDDGHAGRITRQLMMLAQWLARHESADAGADAGSSAGATAAQDSAWSATRGADVADTADVADAAATAPA